MNHKQLKAAMQLCCNRCGYAWIRRTFTDPSNCPGCKSPFWNKKRVREISPERRAKAHDDNARQDQERAPSR